MLVYCELMIYIVLPPSSSGVGPKEWMDKRPDNFPYTNPPQTWVGQDRLESSEAYSGKVGIISIPIH